MYTEREREREREMIYYAILLTLKIVLSRND